MNDWLPCDSNAVPLSVGLYPTRRANGIEGFSQYTTGGWWPQRRTRGGAASARPQKFDAENDKGREWRNDRQFGISKRSNKP